MGFAKPPPSAYPFPILNCELIAEVGVLLAALQQCLRAVEADVVTAGRF